MYFIKTNRVVLYGIIFKVINVDILKGLNKEQTEAVKSESQHIRVIAGAGSGKTRVLISRIIYLIKQRQIPAYKICAITFTNKAANEMKQRLEDLEPSAYGVNTSTIHALCVRILRDEHEAIGYPRYFTILDVSDQESILKEIYRQHNIDRKQFEIRKTLSMIGEMKFNPGKQALNNLYLDPDTIEMNEKIFRLYRARCRDLQALDFDDLLLETHHLLRDRPDITKRWQDRYDVILVDEFQDVDNIQYGIIQNLAGKVNQLYIVGDPDQTIYTWRGADVRNITQFDKLYPDTQTITLNTNYRSSQIILDAANELIQYNKERTAKDLVAHQQLSQPIQYQEFPSSDDEAYWIANQIKYLQDKGEAFHEMAVLYRSSYLTRSLERLLIQRGIPYLIYGGTRFYDRKEVKDMVAFLRMITHGDDLALRRSVGSSPRGIGNKSLEGYWDRAQGENSTMYQVMLSDVENQVAGARIKAYVELIETLRFMAETESIVTLIDYTLEKSGMAAYLKKKDEEDRIDNIKELQMDAMQFEKSGTDETLHDFIQMVSLYGEKSDVVEEDHVRLMTIHAAKGLEFNNVFIMGVAEGVFPSRRSLMESHMVGLEEERRLMYVAITRAKMHLYVSNNSEYSFVSGGSLRPSRFIKESGVARKPVPALKKESDRRVYTLFETEVDEEELIPSHLLNKDALVHHSYFGDGIITKVNKESFVIDFGSIHGKREIAKRFEGLRERIEQTTVLLDAGDKVNHEIFGDGIVIKVLPQSYQIAFNFPHGLKEISNTFNGLKKRE